MAKENKLKMKFKLHQLEFELEGEQEAVKEQFENFKSFISQDLLPKINVEESSKTPAYIEPKPHKELVQVEEVPHEELVDTPSLKDIKLRDLAKTESDWMVVYSFLASKGGTTEFNRSDIIQLYKDSDRHSEKKTNGISQYIKNLAKAEIIKATNDDEYIILEKGKKRANEIFAGKSKSKASSKPSTKIASTKESSKKKSGTKSTKTTNFKLDRNLNLRPEGKESLVDFSKKYNCDSTPKRILMITYYIKEVLQLDMVTTNHIYTAFEKLNIRVPKSLYQLISDTKNKFGWLNFESTEDISLSIQGKNAIKFDLPIEK